MHPAFFVVYGRSGRLAQQLFRISKQIIEHLPKKTRSYFKANSARLAKCLGLDYVDQVGIVHEHEGEVDWSSSSTGTRPRWCA